MNKKSISISLLLLGAGIASLWISNAHHLERALGSPALRHPAGFDAFGRDLLSLLLLATARSFGIAGLAGLLCVGVALVFAGVHSLAPGKIRFFAGRTLDFLLSFPSLLLALTWASMRSPGWWTLAGALVTGHVPGFAKILSARADEVLREDFIQSARAVGRGRFGIFHAHVMPHLSDWVRLKLPPLLAHLILAEAALTFLGVGAPIGSDTLGSLLAQGRDYLIEAPHILVAAGLPLFVVTLRLRA